MNDKTFHIPVFVLAGEHIIQEIEWPQNLRGPIYETALRACYRAHDGHIPVNVARDAFAQFAKSARILKEMSEPFGWTENANAGRGGVLA